MTHALKDISVVICAYTEDRWDDLLLAIDSVRQQSVPPGEIIVVVDHNPSLLQRVKAEAADVVAVDNSESPGLSGARNCGIEVACGTVVAFLDDDAVAEPLWLEEISAGYEDPLVVGVGGAVRPMWKEGRPEWFPAEFDWVVGCSYQGMPRTSARVRNLLGCNMSFRKELFAACGRFRNGLGRVGTRPVGCEETELCIRAIQNWPNRILLYKPSALVYHRVPAKRACWSYFVSRCYSEGLSKAQVKRFVGIKDGLASERQYAMKTLPRGGVRGLRDGLVRRDPSGFLRAGSIVVGLASTMCGYLVATVAEWPSIVAQRLTRRVGVSGE